MRRPSSSGGLLEELLLNDRASVSSIASRTGFPTWKVSRLLKRLELGGLVKLEVEVRRVRGRPRKFYSLTGQGVTLASLLAGDGYVAECRALKSDQLTGGEGNE